MALCYGFVLVMGWSGEGDLSVETGLGRLTTIRVTTNAIAVLLLLYPRAVQLANEADKNE